MGTQFRLAECYEKLGSIASAYQQYMAVADAAKEANKKDRELVARKRADALEPRIARLTIVIGSALLSCRGWKSCAMKPWFQKSCGERLFSSRIRAMTRDDQSQGPIAFGQQIVGRGGREAGREHHVAQRPPPPVAPPRSENSSDCHGSGWGTWHLVGCDVRRNSRGKSLRSRRIAGYHRSGWWALPTQSCCCICGQLRCALVGNIDGRRAWNRFNHQLRLGRRSAWRSGSLSALARAKGAAFGQSKTSLCSDSSAWTDGFDRVGEFSGASCEFRPSRWPSAKILVRLLSLGIRMFGSFGQLRAQSELSCRLRREACVQRADFSWYL